MGTRFKAAAKLTAITNYVGYPKELLDDEKLSELYADLEMDDGHFFKNSARIAVWKVNKEWKKLREKVDKTDWKRHAYPTIVNAFYSPVENSIQFPAGILQGIFYDKRRPHYLNFGSIGIIIGHELTHGFDDRGRQFNDEGNLVDWWEPETKRSYLEKTACIVDQYSNYTAKSVGMNLNGVNTQGENIADNGGIKEAYRGYAQWVRDNGDEEGLPGLDLTPKQLFWVGVGNVWCEKYRPNMQVMQIKTGYHSPSEFRVKGPLSNLKEFSQDFGCALGSPMNPVDKCQVW